MRSQERDNARGGRPCRDGQHSLKAVYQALHTADTVAVVRWCIFCGGVVVDEEYDGRVQPGKIVEMQFPEVTKGLIVTE